MEETKSMSLGAMILRFAIMIGVSALVGISGIMTGTLNSVQGTSCAVFIAIIFGTLFFWNFRLAIAFLGLAVLIFTKSTTIPVFVQSSSLEVILFLVGMMIIVGALRDLGFFTWIVQKIVSVPNLTGTKFVFLTTVSSALLACAVDEVTSIIFISTLIFQVCDRLKLSPKLYILVAVLATNIGSSGTMMGNPVGIYIGNKGGLTFGDFMIWAFPIMLLCLFATVAFLCLIFRKEFKKFDAALENRLAQGLSLAPTIDVPYKAGLILLLFTVCIIACHHPLESFFGLGKNSVLIVTPLIVSGIVMIIKSYRARYYVEREVDWWTLIFFLLLFAVAGTLEYTHVDQIMAKSFSKICGTSTLTLVPFIFGISAVGSAFVDNVVFVAAFCPVIEQLAISVKDFPLWWALLFGACYGGNITMIGSTANIVALGMLEKRSAGNITFFEWLKVGLLCTILSGAIVVGALLVLSNFMADRPSDVRLTYLQKDSGRDFSGKLVNLQGDIVQKAGETCLMMLEKTDDGKNITAYIKVNGKVDAKDDADELVTGILSKDETNADYPWQITVKE